MKNIVFFDVVMSLDGFVAPVFFGEGLPLFLSLNSEIKIRIKKTQASNEVTHVTYGIEK